MLWIIIAVVVIAIFCMYLFCIAPNKKRRDKMEPLEKYYIAHRGLFDNSSDCPENSLAAFKKAADNGYGIELDLQLTADNQVVVFHDMDLLRMCGVEKDLINCTYDELQQYKLADTEERIPLFEEVLKVVDGKVPLVVEIKADGDCDTIAITKKMIKIMENYKGYYCMECFDPFAVKWMRDNRPDIIRGQLSSNGFKDEWDHRKWYKQLLSTYLLMNFMSRPDFIAYRHKYSNNISYKICTKLFGAFGVAWTARNQNELDKAKKSFDSIIFDSFIPSK